MIPGNSSWLPWTSSERAFAAWPLLEPPIHTGSDDHAKGPPRSNPTLAAILPWWGCRHQPIQRIWYFVHIFNQIDLGLEPLNDSPRRNAVTTYARAAALRSTALATSLVLAVGFSTFAGDA